MARIEIERLQDCNDCEDFGFTFPTFAMGHSTSKK